MRPELKGLAGGKKQFWLRTHRKEVENFYFEHGAEATLKEYNLRQDTLTRFFEVERSRRETAMNKLSWGDKFVMEYSRAGIAEVRKRVRDLEDWQAEVQPVIAVGKALIDATMVTVKAKVENTPLPADHLQLANFGEKSEK